MTVDDAIRNRRSLKSYDPAPIDDATLRDLFTLVARTPSSFNLQHWRFVVVRDPARRAELCAASYGQPHVGAAPAVVVVAAKLAAHEDAARANGHAPAPVLDKLVPIIERTYAGDAQLMRDEAIRSASLAAMTLMLVAQAHGLATCPMIGFDPARVKTIARLDDGHIPVMLVTLGRPGPGKPFPTSRFPLAETVRLETLDGPGLGGSA
jgi:nitroreductase